MALSFSYSSKTKHSRLHTSVIHFWRKKDLKYEKAFEFEANEESVKLRFPDGTILRLDRKGIEASIIRTVSDQIVLDMLAFKKPFAYVQLMLNGDPRSWLQRNHTG